MEGGKGQVGKVGMQHGDEGRVCWDWSLLRLWLQISTRAARVGCSPCPLLEQVIFSQTFNTQTSLIWFLSWSQMGIGACKQMLSRAAYLLPAANSKQKEQWGKHRNYYARGWAASSAHHFSFPLHSRALLQVTWTIGKFVLWAYLTCTYRDAFFAADSVCILINAVSLTCHWRWHWDLCLLEMGPRGEWWDGFFHHAMAASPTPPLAALLHHQPKPFLGHPYNGDKFWQPTSILMPPSPTQSSPQISALIHSSNPPYSWTKSKLSQ